MYGVPYMIIGSASFQLGLQDHRNSQYHDLGEGYRVRETATERIFVFGNGRFGVEDKKEGGLDKVLINLPISPMMGGPGYVPFKVKTTPEDIKNFERASSLLKSMKKNPN